MAIQVQVSGDIKRLTRHLNKVQRKVIPKVAREAINLTAKEANAESIKEVAQQVRLPQKMIRARTKVTNAKGRNLQKMRAEIDVTHRGISLNSIRLKATKRGVRAKGDRLYKGAFITKVRRTGQEIAVKRVGPRRYPLFVPRVGIRQKQMKAYEARLRGREGRERFRSAFNRRLVRELNRIGA